MPVIMAEPGTDKVNAAIAAAIMLGTFGPDLVIFSGIANSLDPALDVSNVVIGRHTLQYDYGCVETNIIPDRASANFISNGKAWIYSEA